MRFTWPKNKHPVNQTKTFLASIMDRKILMFVVLLAFCTMSVTNGNSNSNSSNSNNSNSIFYTRFKRTSAKPNNESKKTSAEKNFLKAYKNKIVNTVDSNNSLKEVKAKVECDRGRFNSASAFSACRERVDSCLAACERSSGYGAGFCAATSSFLIPVVNLA